MTTLAFNLSLLGNSNSNPTEFPNREQLFNADWKFIRDSITGAEQVDFDDSGWLNIDLPHDYSMMDLPGDDTEEQIGPFSKKSPGNGNSTGQVIGGTGCYRKSFTMDQADKGKTVVLNFDGVYMESEVWVNGKKAGVHKNGYTPFWFDITNLLNEPGKTNIVAVKVENNGRNSRWYSGSGIYRNVHLIVTNPVHVAVWGVKVTTPEINANSALVNVELTAQNDGQNETAPQITINIKDKDGNIVGTTSDKISIKSQFNKTIKSQIRVENPELWSLESPNLYSAEIAITEGNKTLDKYNQSFGIRSIEFSAEKGFLLNGKPVLLKGACIHHDNGLLGSAAFDRAEERKVELLKANGFNAIRAAHNPYSETFYQACDRLGMLVIDEFTDMWEYYKNPQDYSRFFKDWWEKDVTDWMLRDRNHPGIIMWSIGNEIYEPEDTTRLRIASQLAGKVRELDDTRAVTTAITGFFYPDGWETTTPVFNLMDVCGYNYMLDNIEADHELFPNRIIYTSESYPKDAYAYWEMVEKQPYVIGDFVWTALDYLGEVSTGSTSYVPSTTGETVSGNFAGFKLPKGVNIFDMQLRRPSAWPNFVAECGDIDITGEKRAQMIYRDVLWDNSLLEVSVHEPIPDGFAENLGGWGWPKEYQSWTWKGEEGKPLDVRVFTKAQQVRLELNGKVVGEKNLGNDDKYIAEFKVPYQAGELKAIALENGKEIASKVLRTAGEPASIKLTADRTEITANRNDLSFVKIEIVDGNGIVVPTDSIPIKLEISGNGELAASGNANPGDMDSVNKAVVNSWKGKAQAIVRPFAKAGEITLKAHAEGLKGVELILKTR
ncbi:MAG TPA: glycoside hydrolase family 2 TIM barrel-domain containing protein [Draconibacterium sp.]|nr:glycoside hydrolase family 2 TIM barrel-domain containing protein [Draconibacterium sp.]